MKRTATLVAGLLLVTGTVFGASEWKASEGKVQGTFNLVNTGKGALQSEGNDLYLKFRTEKDFGNAGLVGVEAKFDKNDADNTVKLTYSKTEGDFTVGTSATILEAKESDSGTKVNAGAISLKMAEGSDTYIKWNVMGSKTTTLTFYPYSVDGLSWDNDTWESFTATKNNGGVTLATKVATSDLRVKFAAVEGGTGAEAAYTVKGEFDTKVAGATVNAAAGYVTQTKVQFAAAKASLPMGKLTVKGEVNTEKVASGDAKFGAFAKVSYAMGDVMKYTTTPYAQVKLLNDQVSASKGAQTNIEAGVDMKQGSFTITPKVILNTAEKADYARVKDANEKSEFIAGVKVAYGF